MGNSFYRRAMGISFAVALCSAIMTGCSSSDDSNTPSYSGTVSDGYVSGATVCFDLNDNQMCDSNEPKATTNANGGYTISTTETIPSTAKIIAYGGTDTFTGEEFSGKLFSSVDLKDGTSHNVTPITSLVRAYVDANSGTTVEDAVTHIADTFAIDETMIKADPIAKLDSGSAEEKTKAAIALKQALATQKTVEMVKQEKSNVAEKDIFNAIVNKGDLTKVSEIATTLEISSEKAARIQNAVTAIKNSDITADTTAADLKQKQRAIQVITEMVNNNGSTEINATVLAALETKIGTSEVDVSAIAKAYKDESLDEIQLLNASDFASTARNVTIEFDAVVGSEPLLCSEDGVAKVYTNLGSSKASGTIQDFRYFVSGFKLKFADGSTEALKVINNANQYYDDVNGSVAILDFEDGTGDCIGRGNDARMNRAVVGTVESTEEITGVEFTVGVPRDLNHVQFSDLQKLAKTSMDWNWQGGRKFTKFELKPYQTDNTNAIMFHLGSTGCTAAYDKATGENLNDQDCIQPNYVTMSFTMDPATQKIVLDYSKLLTYVNIAIADQGGAKGCMSGLTDPECMNTNGKMLNMIGLDDAGQEGKCIDNDCTTSQQLFSVESK